MIDETKIDFMRPKWDKQKSPYAKRVEELEAQGLTTSDAQGVADLENLEDWETDNDYCTSYTCKLTKRHTESYHG